jgi:AraC-like DNA-binding protein
MLVTPKDSPGRPSVLGDVEQPDALSEILDAVRLRGGTVVRFAPRQPFTVEIPNNVRVVHLIEYGSMELRIHGQPGVVNVNAGDMLLLAGGDAHTLQAGEGSTPRPLSPEDRVVSEDSTAPRWLTGTFSVTEAAAGRLLSVLPHVIALTGIGHEWHDVSLRMLTAEITAEHAGSSVMVSRILDLVFVHALRAWAAGRDHSPGWLTAAVDPKIGRALTAIHREPERTWSVRELADIATMSRSIFTERFTRLLGTSPVAYVTEVRLNRASHLLHTTSLPVAEISRTVGYTSEAAFSRAFHRRFGLPPLRWRHQQT